MTPWQAEARCGGHKNPDQFFPEYGRNPRAKRFCTPCPVKDQCLQTALNEGLVGVWGGTTKFQRDRISKPAPSMVMDDVVVERIWSGSGQKINPNRLEVQALVRRAERHGMTIAEFASQVDRHRSTIRDWIRRVTT